MNNLLSFEEYKKQQIVERRIISDILRKPVNEGLLKTKWRKFKATKLVGRILKEEIQVGQEFEERIKETMKELAKACNELESKSKRGSEFTKKVNKIISEINNISFDALTLIGDQNIDFSGFAGSVAMANVVNWGAMLSPIKNYLMIKKAYNYFIGLVKQTIRKDLVMLIVNFDQFQNMILQKSLESSENARMAQEIAEIEGKVTGELNSVLRSAFKGDQKGLKNLEQAQKIWEKQKKEQRESIKHDPVASLMMNSYDNTYKQTAETIKSFINEDNQKQLEALKNGISKLGQGDEDLSVYGELLICTAEEKALKTSNSIHNNFLKMSEVFKLSNQKNLIELISESEKDESKRLKEENKEIKKKFDAEAVEERIKFVKDEFKKIVDKLGGEDKLKDVTFEKLDELKKENVEFKYENTKLNKKKPTEEISKYDIIIEYLSYMDSESKNILKDKCSEDIKLLIKTPNNYENSYYSYVDMLSDSIEKSLVREDNDDEKCFIDLMVLKSADNIVDVLNKFKILKYNDDVYNEQKKIFKYINDNVVEIEGYDKFVDKIKELSEINKSLPKSIKDDPEKSINNYLDYLKQYKLWRAWEHYREMKKRPTTTDVKKPDGKEMTKSDEPSSPDSDKTIKVKVDINAGRYSSWKKSFEKMKSQNTESEENNKKEGK